jgi:hypothetical protein
MAVAMMYPEGTPGKKTETSSETKEVSATRLSMARTAPGLKAGKVLWRTFPAFRER